MKGGFVSIEDGAPATIGAITILGISGTGKSNAVERTLNFLPGAVRHTGFGVVQIPAIKIDCPSTGNLRQLVFRIIDQIDRKARTPYRKLCQSMKADEILVALSRIMETHFVGLLVIDEFQNLTRSNEGRTKVLNFLVSLANLVKVPVVFVGTPKVEQLMENVFAEARRAGPEIKSSPLTSETWNFFCERTWKYQWVKRPIPLSDEVVSTWFELTQGVPSLATLLFRLAQKEVLGRSETVTAERLRMVSDQYFGLVQPMIRALKENCAADLRRFDDLFLKSLNTLRKKAVE